MYEFKLNRYNITFAIFVKNCSKKKGCQVSDEKAVFKYQSEALPT